MTETKELIERYGQPPFWDDIQPYLEVDSHDMIKKEEDKAN